MASILEMVDRATGRDKFTVLAIAIDQLAEQIRCVSESKSVDDEIATLDVEALASDYGVSFETMRKQLRNALGPQAVIRIGKRWVIRKRKFANYLSEREAVEIIDQVG